MLGRRSLIGGAALLPFAALGSKASACSIVRPTAGEGAAQIAQVEQLFRQWWAREETAFLQAFMSVEDGLLSDEAVTSRTSDGELSDVRDLYGRFFLEPDRYKDLLSITAVDADVFVACAEHAVGGIGPDCSGAPTTHLFLVSFQRARPSELRHIKSASTFAIGQVTNWVG